MINHYTANRKVRNDDAYSPGGRIGLRPDRATLGYWLLRARDLTDSESLPLTQECLARMIGVQRNAVSIVANALQKAGIIRYRRGHIEIRDVAGLRETSCECYRTIKAQHDRLLSARN